MTLTSTLDLIPSLQSLAALEASKNPMRDSEVELPKAVEEWIEIFQKFMPIFENIKDPKYQKIIEEKISSLKKKVKKEGSSSFYIEESTQEMLLEVIKIASIKYFDLFDDEGNSALFEMFSKDALLKDSVEKFKSVAKGIHSREKINIVSASRDNNIDLVDHFINIKVNINRKINGLTALMVAAFKGYGEIVQKLIDAKANLDLQNKNGDTALEWAVCYSEVCQKLIDAKANLDLQSDEGNTVLIRAAKEGCSEIVQKLIDAKANLNLQNKYGSTALMWAADRGHAEIVQKLINANNLNLQNKYGSSALMRAAFKGYSEIVQKLIDAKANLDLQDEYGYTALMFAAVEGNTEIVQKLIDAGANLGLQNDKGNTALMLAVKYDSKKIEEKLRNAIEQIEKLKK